MEDGSETDAEMEGELETDSEAEETELESDSEAEETEFESESAASKLTSFLPPS